MLARGLLGAMWWHVVVPVTVTADGWLSGRATDLLGRGVYEIAVWASSSETGYTYSAGTATDGSYTITLPAGTYTVGLRDPFHFRVQIRSGVVVRDGRTTMLHFPLYNTVWTDDPHLVRTVASGVRADLYRGRHLRRQGHRSSGSGDHHHPRFHPRRRSRRTAGGSDAQPVCGLHMTSPSRRATGCARWFEASK